MTTKELLLSALFIIMDGSLRTLGRSFLKSHKLSGFMLAGGLAFFLLL